MVYEPADGSDGPTVKLHVDTGCEDCGDTEYDLSEVDLETQLETKTLECGQTCSRPLVTFRTERPHRLDCDEAL
ncbi:hypothetical protein [Natronococcus wangiae]|uniref:hypothetical protein n=1 Tax=Natronococcus wangiae TaxID=3068275 RepID=UPI00273F1009|nr:hypothetical protein [Natronococcus sp. AD5]